MTLFNADGSLAEMSGNGIRCFVHALARARGLDRGSLRVATGGGVRTVEFAPIGRRTHRPRLATVDMGPARSRDRWPTRRARHAHHRGGRRSAPSTSATPIWCCSCPTRRSSTSRSTVRPGSTGIPTAPTSTSSRPHPAAPTRSPCGCGSGAPGSPRRAARVRAPRPRAAHDWGLVGPEVVVQMPGGEVSVSLGDTVLLTGPSQWVADIEVPA